jgi:hypothetical protein
VGQAPMKGNLNDVSEVELDFMDFRSVRESIERLLSCGFNFFYNSDDFVDGRLID